MFLDVVVCGSGLQIKVISEKVSSPNWVPFQAVSGQAQNIRRVGSGRRAPKDGRFSRIERKTVFLAFLYITSMDQTKVPAFGASLMFDFGYRFSQGLCSLVEKVKVLGDRTA